jgi:hypothetical protein
MPDRPDGRLAPIRSVSYAPLYGAGNDLASDLESGVSDSVLLLCRDLGCGDRAGSSSGDVRLG